MRHYPFGKQLTTILMLTTAILWGCGGSGASGGHTGQQAETSADPTTDIHTVIVQDDLDGLRRFLESGADLDKEDPFGGSSPLITAAIFGRTEMAELLIEAGADLNFQNNDGSTALISAAFFGHPEIVQLLLNAGADRTIKNKYGATAFDVVAAPFSEVKGTYDLMGQLLAPMGLQLDYAHLEAVRPEIANLLR